MRSLRFTGRAALLLAAAALLLGAPAVSAAAATAAPVAASSPVATTGTGWIRMAHLSPNTPAVDVYLYSYGGSSARIVLHHVTYGSVSAYQTVPAGDYSVAMRPAGDAASSPPVLTASTWVTAGGAYTAAALGPESGVRLQVIRDDLTAPAGKALVRVVQASLKQKQVTVSWNGKVVARNLAFGAVTSYQAVPPGSQAVAVTGDAPAAVTLTKGSIHTLVVLDGARGLQVDNLTDAAGSSQLPKGGAATGFGGTAPHGPGSPLPWLSAIAAGAALTAAGALGRRRARRGAGRRPGPAGA
jgi:Domain of unknown function (DUF4397)